MLQQEQPISIVLPASPPKINQLQMLQQEQPIVVGASDRHVYCIYSFSSWHQNVEIMLRQSKASPSNFGRIKPVRTHYPHQSNTLQLQPVTLIYSAPPHCIHLAERERERERGIQHSRKWRENEGKRDAASPCVCASITWWSWSWLCS
jgi:hypothetical protein